MASVLAAGACPPARRFAGPPERPQHGQQRAPDRVDVEQPVELDRAQHGRRMVPAGERLLHEVAGPQHALREERDHRRFQPGQRGQAFLTGSHGGFSCEVDPVPP